MLASAKPDFDDVELMEVGFTTLPPFGRMTSLTKVLRPPLEHGLMCEYSAMGAVLRDFDTRKAAAESAKRCHISVSTDGRRQLLPHLQTALSGIWSSTLLDDPPLMEVGLTPIAFPSVQHAWSHRPVALPRDLLILPETTLAPHELESEEAISPYDPVRKASGARGTSGSAAEPYAFYRLMNAALVTSPVFFEVRPSG